jgi:hypothetical protein
MTTLNKIFLLLNDRPADAKWKFGCPFPSEHSKYLCDLLVSCGFRDSAVASMLHFLAINLENLANAVSHPVRSCVDLYSLIS